MNKLPYEKKGGRQAPSKTRVKTPGFNQAAS